MQNKGFTLIEMLVAILIVGILASLAIPILRGRTDAAKWSEGKAMMGSVATAIRAYAAEKGPSGALPTAILGNGPTQLGFATGDLTGTYFVDGEFSITVTTLDPLDFEVSCTSSDSDPKNPGTYKLDEAGQWQAL